ncbi:MAG: PIN domain-containing protein [Ignavibacteria bacterium]|nr:PIN domain-containing protein [Ignavibacteria bacterium]MBI3766525.1 PIN domain-containing protein [Ignavibacteriales bacterium]
MGRYILDTGVLVGYLRASSYAEHIEKSYSPFQHPNISAISVVTVGELYSLAIQLRWGDEKKRKLAELLLKVPRIDIHNEEILQKYAEIDSYSQGKNPTNTLPMGLTSRNMGKNDIWISATTSVFQATLLTTDKDFDHLNNFFFSVAFIDPSIKK